MKTMNTEVNLQESDEVKAADGQLMRARDIPWLHNALRELHDLEIIEAAVSASLFGRRPKGGNVHS